MKRCESIDILRGLDMFILVMFGYFVYAFYQTGDFNWLEPLNTALEHSKWQGFTLWDLVMPLFMFTSGAAIPFACANYRERGWTDKKIYLRILRRFVVLWILGMISQGKLLSLDPSQFLYYGNTLHAIAIGYTVSFILYLNTKPRTQIIVMLSLLFAYWACMTFIGFGDTPAGTYEQGNNLAQYVGSRFIEITHINVNGSWVFGTGNFIVTVMSGTLGGHILRSGRSGLEKTKIIGLLGVALVAAGWLLNLQHPVIKPIWTSSMVMVSSGYSYILLAIIYFCVDYKGWKKGWQWLLPFGLNAIFIYMCRQLFDLKPMAYGILYGLEQYMSPGWFNFVNIIFIRAVFWGVIYYLYKQKIFIKI